MKLLISTYEAVRDEDKRQGEELDDGLNRRV